MTNQSLRRFAVPALVAALLAGAMAPVQGARAQTATTQIAVGNAVFGGPAIDAFFSTTKYKVQLASGLVPGAVGQSYTLPAASGVMYTRPVHAQRSLTLGANRAYCAVVVGGQDGSGKIVVTDVTSATRTRSLVSVCEDVVQGYAPAPAPTDTSPTATPTDVVKPTAEPQPTETKPEPTAVPTRTVAPPTAEPTKTVEPTREPTLEKPTATPADTSCTECELRAQRMYDYCIAQGGSQSECAAKAQSTYDACAKTECPAP